MTILQFQHSSLEVFDSAAQKAADARKLFTLGSDIITGTEAGPGKGDVSASSLRAAARDCGYRLWLPRPQDAWIAVNRELITSKGQSFSDKGLIMVLKGGAALHDPHHYGPKGIPWVTVETELGEISVGAGHWLTKGRFPNQAEDDKHGDPVDHFASNTKMGKEVAKWAKSKGRGRGLVFYGADTNLNDATSDVFRGEPMTTCWDEVGSHPSTGHSCIDIIASYNRDGRVSCKSAVVHTDREFFMNSDHYTITANYEIKALPGPR